MLASLKHAGESEIMKRAFELPGRRLGDVAPLVVSRGADSRTTRGDVGGHIERAFGLAPNSSPEPDFPDAGIELKMVPLRERRRGWCTKERTTIALIDYIALAKERAWDSASVRKKLSKILFVFVQWRPGIALSDFVIEGVYLWRPDANQDGYLRADWNVIRAKVAAGQAHLLSDRDTRVLAATTKARDSTIRRPQVSPGPPAKPRAFTLKQAFVDWIYANQLLRSKPAESLIQNLALTQVERFEAAVIKHAERHFGRRIGQLARELGVSPSSAKNYSALVVRKVLGARDPGNKLREFEEFGVEAKIVPLSPRGVPYEAMSFPAFRYKGLVAEEEWEESELHEQLDRLLIVVVSSPTRETSQDDRVLADAFFWSPTLEQEAIIKEEWLSVIELVKRGRADRLPSYGTTRIIHVRTHGRDSRDTDEAPMLGEIPKKSFWLNPGFVAAVVREHGRKHKPM
jgi:DNA mismatch repair endonuclease MutH